MSVDNHHLKQFLNEESHNLLVFASAESRRHVRKVANNLGVDFESPVSTEYKCCLIKV